MPPKHILLALMIAIVWGFNFVVIQVGIASFPPLFFSALRFFFAAVPLIFFIGPRPAPWRYIFGVGIMIGGFQFSLLFVGMDVGMSAGLASLLMQTQVFYTIIFALVLFGDKPSLWQWPGLLISVSGVVLMGMQQDNYITTAGFILIMLAAASWGVGNIIMKKAGKIEMFRFMVWASLVPIIPQMILSVIFEGPTAIWAAVQGTTLLSIGALVYISYLATLFGFGGWGWLLARYPASSVTPFALTVPVAGMLSSMLLLGETFTLIKLIAAALVLGGLILNTIAAKRKGSQISVSSS